MKKVIGIVSAHYLPHLGGVERYVFNLATELVNRGYRVVIITSRLSGMKKKEVINGIEIYRLPCFGFMNDRLPVIKRNQEFRQLVKELDEIIYDSILVNTRLYTLSAWGVNWCRKKNISPILLEHGTAHMHFDNKLISAMGECYEHMLTWYIKRKCKTYMGVSKGCNQWLQHYKIYTDKVLYNAVNEKDYENVSFKFRKQLNIPEEAIIISFVGRLITEKGILKLIDACGKLGEKKVPFYLLIAGNGDLTEQIKSMCNEQIILLGNLEHSEVISLLSETDIYCLPTDYPEGFPTAILEAAMCGCCIVATEAGGTKELIIDGKYGCLLNKNDANEITEVLYDLIESPNKIKELGSNVKQRVQDNFTWKKTVDTLEKVMEES